jgi:hypothetical protein
MEELTVQVAQAVVALAEMVLELLALLAQQTEVQAAAVRVLAGLPLVVLVVVELLSLDI